MMDAGALFPLFAIIPFLCYIAVLVFGIWFAVSLIKTQKEKNQILREISRQLEQSKKDET
jgi:fucose permease